ncbi:hypothetical protein Q9L58_008713 [Maublancomyces gigas]|uniref:UBL3-like ubiquitin domain-containing protein n=1 Tax=Discina gigas TaxID=1032678 RepID=A0ABR3G8Z4_9PEZI
MSASSPALSPSQAETASPPNSRSESSEQHDASTSMSPLAGDDTATGHYPVPKSQQQQQQAQQQQQQQQQQQEASSSGLAPARAEITDLSELVEGPPAAVALATGTVATPIDNIVPPTAVTTVPVTGESPPSPEMRTPSSSPPIGPSVVALSVTLLLISGVRHQFTMDETYLEQHSVKAQSGKESLRDPFEMSVWQLKECIWKDWKDEWDQRPASAMFIRLIHFGRMLEDRHLLRDCRLNQDTPNVVHMTVRPPEVGDDEMTQRSAKPGFGHSGSNGNSGSSPSCRCVIL